jgi:hypothetical protein
VGDVPVGRSDSNIIGSMRRGARSNFSISITLFISPFTFLFITFFFSISFFINRFLSITYSYSLSSYLSLTLLSSSYLFSSFPSAGDMTSSPEDTPYGPSPTGSLASPSSTFPLSAASTNQSGYNTMSKRNWAPPFKIMTGIE